MEATPAAAVPQQRRPAGAFRFIRNMYKASPLAVVGLALIAIWLLVAVLAPYVATHEPLAQTISMRYKPPSAEHWFGTDKLGRDVFSRVVWGSRVSLPIGVGVVALSAVVGIIIGTVAGYFGKWIDEALMRFSDLVISFPVLILAMALAAALGPSLINSTIAIVAVWWPRYARMMRSLVISSRDLDYVVAADALGARPWRIMLKTIVPNALAPVFILATLDLGTAILTFASLGFLGLGQVPPDPEWGAMVAEGANAFQYWWVGTFPGLAILSVALAFNFVGDALRDLLDPRLRGQI
jgi:peptide/nickel transport system permease protein